MEELTAQERSLAWLARKLYCDRSNIYKLLKKQSLDMEPLRRISVILQRDFFSVYSDEIHLSENSVKSSGMSESLSKR